MRREKNARKGKGGREEGALISYKDKINNKERDLSIFASIINSKKREYLNIYPDIKKKTSKLKSTLCGNLHD